MEGSIYPKGKWPAIDLWRESLGTVAMSGSSNLRQLQTASPDQEANVVPVDWHCAPLEANADHIGGKHPQFRSFAFPQIKVSHTLKQVKMIHINIRKFRLIKT